ncbi:MAG: c-type cytochrome, partial [Verrucomicrobiales bacterium]|nr:c-type cytochrome [Verrucomicrobiales bacterium]
IPGKPDEWRLAQAALAQLGSRAVTDPQAEAALRSIAGRASRDGFPDRLLLDLREARRALRADTRDGRTNLLEIYSVCLTGGDSVRGRDVFFNNPTVQCLRCHKVSGEGGTVGPDLTGIGGRRDRPYLLESLVMPNARMAPGFESVVLTLQDGSSLAGTLKRESDAALELDVLDPDTGEARQRILPKASVVSRERGVSAMPDGLAAQLSPFEVRDLVEYLAGLK